MLDVAHPAFDLVGMSQDLFLIGEILLLLNGGGGGTNLEQLRHITFYNSRR